MNGARDRERLALTSGKTSDETIAIIDSSNAEFTHRPDGDSVGQFAIENRKRPELLDGFDTHENDLPMLISGKVPPN